MIPQPVIDAFAPGWDIAILWLMLGVLLTCAVQAVLDRPKRKRRHPEVWRPRR